MRDSLSPNTKVLLIGASGGIGQALGDALSATTLTRLSRSQNGLDLTDEASIISAVAGLDGPFEVMIDATGALEIGGYGPEKSLSQIDPAAMAAQFALNATGPALLLKHLLPLLPRKGRAVFASLSARVGSIEDNRLGGWIAYRAAKAALNQVIRTAAIEATRRNPDSIVVALHPGTVETPLTQKYLGRHPAVTPTDAAQKMIQVLQNLRPKDTGGFYDTASKTIPW